MRDENIITARAINPYGQTPHLSLNSLMHNMVLKINLYYDYSSNWPIKLLNFRLITRLSTLTFRLINLIFEFCVVIVQAGCTPRAWLLSDLATSPLVCNLYLTNYAVVVFLYQTYRLLKFTLVLRILSKYVFRWCAVIRMLR